MSRPFHRLRTTPPFARFARPCLEGLELRAAPSSLDSPLLGEPFPDEAAGPVIAQGSLLLQDQGWGETSSPEEVNGPVEEAAGDDAFVGYTPAAPAGGELGSAKLAALDAVVYLSFPMNPAPPVITSFYCTEGVDFIFTFQGTVEGYMPGMKVYFGGEPESLQGKSTSVTSSGTFTLVVQLSGTVDDEGIATAVAKDTFNQTSGVASTEVHQTGVG